MSRGPSIAYVSHSSDKELFPLRTHIVPTLVTVFATASGDYHSAKKKKSDLILSVRLPPAHKDKDQVNLNIRNLTKRSINRRGNAKCKVKYPKILIAAQF